MSKLAFFLISLATPRIDREAVLGDVYERFEELSVSKGPSAARRWLWRETVRTVWYCPLHRLSVRLTPDFSDAPAKDAFMSTLAQDVRFALRWLWRSPGLSAVAVLTLALGLGANTAMFAVVNAVLLKPLPFPQANRLMLVHLLSPDDEAGGDVYRDVVWSYPKFQSFLEVQQVFDDAALFGERAFSLAGDGQPERLQAEVITERYLPVLGLTPWRGRSFTADEANRAGSAPVVMISHGLWSRRYGGDESVVGRSISLGGISHAVVGVMPRGFTGLHGNADLWVPLAVTDGWALTEAMSHSYLLVAARKTDVAEEAAAAAVRVYGGQIDARTRNRPNAPAWGARTISLYNSRIDTDLRRAAVVILGAVGVVLLIACVNLTNLLVAGAMARRREVAIRVALGAAWGRIARQFGIEGLVLAILGAASGLVVAAGLLAVASIVLPDSEVLFRTAVAPGTPRMTGAAGLTRIGASMIGLDGATVLFTAALACLTAVLVSIMPAWQATRQGPASALKTAGGSATATGSRGYSSRGALVAVEIALALVLLAGAGLMLRSAMQLRGTDIGVDPNHVVTAGISLPGASYPREKARAFYEALFARLQALPGVESVGLGNCAPARGGCNATSLWFPPAKIQENSPVVSIHWASPGYFDTLRIPVVEGRDFTERDRFGQPKVAVVNQSAARKYWPNTSAIGQRIAVGQGGFGDGAEIVGVVGDVRYRSLEAAAEPQVYVPILQSHRAEMRIFVRSGLETPALVNTIAGEIQALDGNLPLIGVKSLDGYIGDAMWRTRVATWLLLAFAGLALLLTAIGVFGVMAQTVAQRTAEFGIRMALGAQRRDVFALVLRRGAIVTGSGLALGLLGALALTRVLGSLLYGVEPHDPLTLGAVVVMLGIVSLAACYLPARRATRVDAIVALRSE